MPMVLVMLLSVTAARISSRGTRPGIIACQPGMVSA